MERRTLFVVVSFSLFHFVKGIETEAPFTKGKPQFLPEGPCVSIVVSKSQTHKGNTTQTLVLVFHPIEYLFQIQEPVNYNLTAWIKC